MYIPSSHLSDFFTQQGKEIKYKKHQLVIRPEDPSAGVMYLVSGLIKISFKLWEGEERLLGFFQPGAVFAKSGSFFHHAPSSSLTLEALNECRVFRLPTELFFEHLKSDSELTMQYLQWVAFNNLALIDRAIYQSQKQSKSKCLKWLQFMDQYYGQYDEATNSSVIPIPLTYEDIANCLSLTREQTNKVIRSLLREGLISREKKIITILDRNRLFQL